MLVEQTLFGVVDKVQIAIERIRQFEPPEGYYVAFSGGKDSCVVLDLVKKSGVKYDAHYRHVGFDPPELVRFIKCEHHDVQIDLPKQSQWSRMAKTGPATRMMRWCCDHKESGGKGRIVVTGVRHEESARRAQRKVVEQCYRDNSKRYLNPIIDWTIKDVWQYIHGNNIPYCSLYDEGWKRLGCIMCPLANREQREKEARRWPKYAFVYKKMCERAFERKKSLGHKMPTQWRSGEDMYEWWLSGKAPERPNVDQTVFFFD